MATHAATSWPHARAVRPAKREAEAQVPTLPFLFEPEIGLDEYGALAAKLGRDLG